MSRVETVCGFWRRSEGAAGGNGAEATVEGWNSSIRSASGTGSMLGLKIERWRGWEGLQATRYRQDVKGGM